MIPQTVEKDIIRSGAFKERRMGIDVNSKALIFGVLRKGLYQDPIKSLMREYITNGIDEHQKLQKPNVPVEITFPTTFASELRIRDFGVGLDEEQFFHFFGDYGASDKRDSNEMIGSFGLGCKSAFAYTDSFTVVSIKNGIKSTYNLYIDETDEGSIAKLTEEETSEPSGLEIVIPVKRFDSSTFISKGSELLRYLKTRPVIKGATIPEDNPTKPALEGKGWRYYGDNRQSMAICGQIGYPIDRSKMGEVKWNYQTNKQTVNGIAEWEYNMLGSGIELEFNIGELQLVANREQLQMSKEFTIPAIRAKLSIVRAEIQAIAEEKFKTAKTILEAKTAFFMMFQKGGSYGRTLQESIGEVKWNGIAIKDSTIKLNLAHSRVLQYTKRNRNGNILYNSLDKIQCSDTLKLYYDDTDRKAFMYRRRAKTLLDAGATQVLVVQSDKPAELKKETGIDVTTLDKYSAVTPTVLNSTRVGTGIDVTKRAKHQVSVFELDIAELSKGYSKGANSDYWKVAKIVQDKQVYIPIDRFLPTLPNIKSMYDLRYIVKHLEALGMAIDIPIYGLKPKENAGKMVKFDDWLIAKIKTIKNLAHDVALIQDIKTDPFELTVDLKDLPAKSLAAQYKVLHDEAIKLLGKNPNNYWNPDIPEVQAKLFLAKNAKLDLPDRDKLVNMEKELLATYPLITTYDGCKNADSLKAIAQYIKLIGK